METLAGAVRYALRQFWFSRVFTAAAVLTVVLGIGGTTAIFALIHAPAECSKRFSLLTS